MLRTPLMILEDFLSQIDQKIQQATEKNKSVLLQKRLYFFAETFLAIEEALNADISETQKEVLRIEHEQTDFLFDQYYC